MTSFRTSIEASGLNLMCMMRELVVYRSPTIILYGQTCAMANGHTAVGPAVALKYLQV